MNHWWTMVGEFLIAAGILAAAARYAFSQTKGRGISIIIPFRAPDNDDQRAKNFEWLKRYWKAQLPGAEIIHGEDNETCRPFSKSVAVNNGVCKSHGDVLVIVDADGYIPADSIVYCAEEIREAEARDHRLWFVPYRRFFRLTQEASKWLLDSKPETPFQFPTPVPSMMALGDNDPTVGHWYGAMIQVCSRNAFDIVGGWDERFCGWGGEDAAALRSMDTLYALHKTLPGQVVHVWHPQFGPQGKATQVHWSERMWEGQDGPGANTELVGRYYAAWRNVPRMRKLVDEAMEWARWHRHHGHHEHEHHEHHHKHHEHHHHHKHPHHHHHPPSV